MAKIDVINSLRLVKNVVLMGHKDGDGDNFGALFGLKIGLEKLGKNVQIISSEDLPRSLSFFHSYMEIKISRNYWPGAKVLVIVDTPDLERTSLLKIVERYIEEGKKILLIDHHLEGNLVSMVNAVWVEQNKCSASEMVYDILKDFKVEIDKNISTVLLTGIDTDTSSFQNQNTTNSCLVTASELISHGARLGAVVKNSFSNQPISYLKTWGLILSRLRINHQYQTATSYLTPRDLEENQVEPSLLTGMTNFLNVIKDVKMVIFLAEVNPGLITVEN
jgi:phosphoesterase RecJ-like protein